MHCNTGQPGGELGAACELTEVLKRAGIPK